MASSVCWLLNRPRLPPQPIPCWPDHCHAAIACFPIYAAIQLWLPETLRTLVGNGESQSHYGLWKIQPFRQKNKDGKVPTQPSRVRVFWALLVYPPNLIIITSTALLFAGLYAILVDFTRLWLEQYGWSEAEAGYAYLCPGERSTASDPPLSTNAFPTRNLPLRRLPRRRQGV